MIGPGTAPESFSRGIGMCRQIQWFFCRDFLIFYDVSHVIEHLKTMITVHFEPFKE
uniref:Uncharacterized protein n=1 Tax=Parascaris equorum TaxID=6256 RepID=A0A914R2F9_PAREQ